MRRFASLYVRVLRLLGRDLRLAGLLGGANLVVAALQFLDPLLFGRVVQLVSGADAAAHWPALLRVVAVWGAAGLLGIAAGIATATLAERLAHRNRLQLIARFVDHALTLPPAFHGQAHSGRMMNTLLSGADGMFWLWLTFFREQLATLLATVVLLPLTLLLNWRLALGLIVLVAGFCTATALVIRRTEDGQQRAQHHQGALAAAAQDALANVAVLQSFARLELESRRLREIVAQVIRAQFPVLNWWALLNVLTRASSTVAVIAIVVGGAALHAGGHAGVGEIVSFVGLATMLIGRLDTAMAFASRLFFEAPGVRAFLEVLDTRSTVPQAADAPKLRVHAGRVVFQDVTFAYPGGPPVLDAIDLHARPGSVVALVGHTGAGKSTAMALLQRLWDPGQGRILVDGQDIRCVSLDSLRRAIGVVFQDSMLLNRSIRENLLVGDPHATQERLEQACRAAQAHDFIVAQPDGYDTPVGERGATLSGGQRQRLAIARALLKDPPILILDEATSALDAATEARVVQAMRTLMQGRTTFVVAHRLSTVRDADEILVFDAGRIVERGSFAALLARRGRFAALVDSQLSPVPAAAGSLG